MKRIFSCMLLAFLCLCTFAQKARVKVSCVGNSITYGTGISDRDNYSYPVQLQRMLGEGYEVRNFGRPGATLLRHGHRPYVNQPEYKDALAFAGDIVVIHLGINDTDPRNWPNYRDEFIGDYCDLIASFREVNPKCRVLIARMTPIAPKHPRFESGTRDWHGEIQQAIETVARTAGVEMIDFFAPLYPHPELLPDAIHPDAKGAGILAKVVYQGITGIYGGLRMPRLYTDNMVLQRDVPLAIHGMADAGEPITVRLNGRTYRTQTAPDGKWRVTAVPMKAGGPYELTVSSPKKSLTFKNILVGEVWLCSGQSNMEFRLKACATVKEDLKKADCADLRLFDMKARWRTDAKEWAPEVMDSLNNMEHYSSTAWTISNPKAAAEFSAIAYHFGRMLQDSLKVPVGLICNAVGGSPTEAWIDRSTLEYEFPAILKDWAHNDFVQGWVRGRASQNIAKAKNPAQRHPYKPCYLYETGILPLDTFAVKGCIWYQGESNAHNMEAHEKLFHLLVKSWRRYWNNEDMPFYFVQLSSLNRPSWPWFRDSQRKLMQAIPHTGMAVSSDKGDSLDVHPIFKKEIGERLARWALNHDYEFAGVVPSGPLYRSNVVVGKKVGLSFDYAHSLRPADGNRVRGLEVAGDDECFYPAEVQLKGDTVWAWNDKVARPAFVRYAWQPFTRANLVNGDGLPASTFRCEVTREKSYVPVQKMKVSGLADKDGFYQQGVSATYVGTIGGSLLVAGGCNFPVKPVAEGGAKHFYDAIYQAELDGTDSLAFHKIGKLPQTSAYGVTVEALDGLVLIGGRTEKEGLKSVYYLTLKKGKPMLKKWPSLPVALDNMAGAVLDDKIYVVGGNADGVPSSALYVLDMNALDKGWAVEKPVPGNPRVQPVCAAQNGRLYVWGGFSTPHAGQPATLSVDGYSFDPSTAEWTSCSTPCDESGKPVALCGGTSLPLSQHRIVCVGGVNKDIFLRAISGGYDQKEYLSHPMEWYKFNRRMMVYDCRTDQWKVVDRSPYMARAGATMAFDGLSYYIIQGELKPGIRSTDISRFTIK